MIDVVMFLMGIVHAAHEDEIRPAAIEQAGDVRHDLDVIVRAGCPRVPGM